MRLLAKIEKKNCRIRSIIPVTIGDVNVQLSGGIGMESTGNDQELIRLVKFNLGLLSRKATGTNL